MSSSPLPLPSPSPSRSHVIFSISLILIGCCLNVIDLEFITKADPGAGVLVTCAQFVFIASEGFFQHYRAPLGFIPRVVPLSVYLKLTLVFFVMSVINNQALAFSISMPVHTVFRSSSLAASLFLGMTIYNKKYTRTQILSCLLVTFGIMIITLADATLPKECCNGGNTHGSNTTILADTQDKPGSLLESTRWLIGICMLTLALLMSAYLGHEQDSIFNKYGKNWKEMLFYTHLLSLPAFLVTWESIKQHIYIWMTAPPVTLFTISGYGPITVSLSWLLIGNLLSQMVCVRGVYMLTSSSGALTATLIITLRKFISLIISIVYFANPFTMYHWFGTLLVFIGLCTYSYPASIISPSTSTPRKVHAPTPSPSVMRADDGSDPTSVNGTYHVEYPEQEQEQEQEQQQEREEVILQPKPRRGHTLTPPHTATKRITRSMSRTRTEETSAVATTTSSDTRTPSKRRTRKDSS